MFPSIRTLPTALILVAAKLRVPCRRVNAGWPACEVCEVESGRRQQNTLLDIYVYIFQPGLLGTAALLCSHVLMRTPSFSRFIIPWSKANDLPIWMISHSSRMSSPSGAGRRHVTLIVRVTPPLSQESGLLIACIAMEVHISKMELCLGQQVLNNAF